MVCWNSCPNKIYQHMQQVTFMYGHTTKMLMKDLKQNKKTSPPKCWWKIIKEDTETCLINVTSNGEVQHDKDICTSGNRTSISLYTELLWSLENSQKETLSQALKMPKTWPCPESSMTLPTESMNVAVICTDKLHQVNLHLTLLGNICTCIQIRLEISVKTLLFYQQKSPPSNFAMLLVMSQFFSIQNYPSHHLWLHSAYKMPRESFQMTQISFGTTNMLAVWTILKTAHSVSWIFRDLSLRKLTLFSFHCWKNGKQTPFCVEFFSMPLPGKLHEKVTL